MNTGNNIDEKMLLDDERIANYLKGRMTAEEEQLFMQELQSNPELKAKAVAMARMVKGMKEVGTANDKELMSEFLATDAVEVGAVAKDVSTAKKSGKVISWRKTVTWLSAAASVALLIWAGIGYNDYRTTTGLGEQYSTVFTSSQLTRGGENGEVELKLMSLMDNIAQKKDMDNTLHELALCWELATQDTYNDYTDYAPEIGWNLAIAHLKNNDRKQAKAVLEKLTGVPSAGREQLIGIAPAGTAIGDKARELLKKID